MTPKEYQTWVRIRLSVAAYAYEYKSESVMTDHEFDSLSKEVDLKVDTDNKLLDKFFKRHFEPDTGMWIRFHPNKKRLEFTYDTYYKRT